MDVKTVDADIVQAIVAHPDEGFTGPTLRQARFVSNTMGRPICWNGARAFVFCAEMPTGERVAVRIPKHATSVSQQRYVALDEHVTANPDLPLVATFWEPAGARYDEVEYPVITMDWVEGTTLDRFLDDASASGELNLVARTLTSKWVACVDRMERAGLAHGDIHAANVLVRSSADAESCEIVLVDYDCVWLPTISTKATEEGHPAYQHPDRRGFWGPEMDAFPATLVYLSLAGLQADPNLWLFRDGVDGKLIFDQEDLLRPASSKVFANLKTSPSSEVRHLVGLVEQWLSADPLRYSRFAEIADASPSGDLGEPAPPADELPDNTWPPPPTIPEAVSADLVWAPGPRTGPPPPSSTASPGIVPPPPGIPPPPGSFPPPPSVPPPPKAAPSPASNPGRGADPEWQSWPSAQPGGLGAQNPGTVMPGPTNPISNRNWRLIILLIVIAVIVLMILANV